jgi:hypothetical protein
MSPPKVRAAAQAGLIDARAAANEIISHWPIRTGGQIG